MDGEEKGETDQRARDERKYRTGQVRWTQMMRKREMCTGEDTGELEESREGELYIISILFPQDTQKEKNKNERKRCLGSYLNFGEKKLLTIKWSSSNSLITKTKIRGVLIFLQFFIYSNYL